MEEAITAVSAANPGPAVLPPIRRRKLGTHRNIRTPVFLDRLSELALEEAEIEKECVSTNDSIAVPMNPIVNQSTQLPPVSLAPVHLQPLSSLDLPMDGENALDEPRKRRRKQHKKTRPSSYKNRGPFLRLFREEELDTFHQLKRRLTLERTRLQHQITNVNQCSANLNAWLNRNPPHLKKTSTVAAAILQAMKKPSVEV